MSVKKVCDICGMPEDDFDLGSKVIRFSQDRFMGYKFDICNKCIDKIKELRWEEEKQES